MAETAAHTKVTRADWLAAARAALVREGVDGVKVLTLSDELGVSRSSFYWYFRDRAELLEALLEDWEARSTRTLVGHCARPSAAICEAACNFFRCFVDPALFDTELDFAVRAWARRDAGLRARVDAADAARLSAVTAMFLRHDYPPADADARARILYYMQLGYHALEVREAMPLRLTRVPAYLKGFTGRPPRPETLAAFEAFALGVAGQG